MEVPYRTFSVLQVAGCRSFLQENEKGNDGRYSVKSN